MTVASLMIDLLVHGHGRADAAPLFLISNSSVLAYHFKLEN